jgi:hypothetical protein
MAETAIKTIRIRNSNGTYGDPMPIGANSNNIEVIADSSTLSDVLGPVNVLQYGSIQEQLNNLLQKVTVLELKVKELEDNLL